MLNTLNNSIQNNLNISNLQTETKTLKGLKDEFKIDPAKHDKKLKSAAEQFESVFINQLLQIMDKTVDRSEFMHGGQGEAAFRNLFYQEISKNIASNPATSFGLAKQVYEQLSKYD
jgi:flagellar protein FlgJ